MPFRPGQLRYFVTVAEAGQITRAAKQLHLAQPALSQALAQLEAQLGVKLLDRHARGVTLTSAGEAFLTKAKAVLRAEADATATARSLARITDGAIELGFVGTPPIVVAPELFDTFKRDYAQVELSFRELRFPTGSTAGWLESVDVALCFSPTAHEDVATQTLWREPRALLVGADHRFADAEALDVEDVLDEPFYGHHETVDPLWAGFWTLDDHRGGPARLTADRPVSSLELIATISSGRALRAFSSSTARTIARVLDKLVAVPLRDAAPAACELAWSRAHAGPLVQTLVETARAIGESTSGKARATEARASVRR